MRVILLLLAAIMFAACSEDDPVIADSQAVTVLSYDDEDKPPERRLAVFVQTSSDVRRAECVTLVSPDNSYDWTLMDPITISGNEGMWAGGVSFVMPNGEAFPAGEYKLQYTDAKGSQVQCTVQVASGDDSDDGENSDSEEEKRVAVYDAEDTLLYYGENQWANDNAVWQAVKGSAAVRDCIVQDAGRVIRMMPPRKKSAE